MTNETKKRLGTICYFVSSLLLLVAIYGMMFFEPEPVWSRFASSLGLTGVLFVSFLLILSRRRTS